MSLIPTQPCAILIGDSITQNAWVSEGLATRLSNAYVRQLDIVNRGFSGFTTRDVLPVAKDFLSKETDDKRIEINFTTLFLGANDACLFGDQCVPLSEFGPNLRKILNLIPSSVPRLLLTPPIPDGPTWAASKGIPGLEPNRTEENTAKYAEVAREVAREMKGEGVELVDVWQAMDNYRSQEGQKLGDLLSDGLHLTERGYKLLSDLVLDHLASRSAAPKPNGL